MKSILIFKIFQNLLTPFSVIKVNISPIWSRIDSWLSLDCRRKFLTCIYCFTQTCFNITSQRNLLISEALHISGHYNVFSTCEFWNTRQKIKAIVLKIIVFFGGFLWCVSPISHLPLLSISTNYTISKKRDQIKVFN